VTVLGVDDFAFRRGRASGTILLDLERQRVIDVLPDRTQETCARWVQQHPQVQFISRDRGGDYAAGARAGAPQAVQIADRFHLLKNAGEALERGLTRHASVLRQAAQSLTPADAVTRTTKRTPGDARRQQERRAARQARYEQVMTLHQQGLSPRQIAQQTGVARGTVLTYLRAPSFPEVAPRPRPRHIDPYMAYLRERWNAGEHNARALWREIRVQGYQAGDEQVRRVVNAWRTDPHWHGNQPSIPQGPAKAEQMTMSAHKTRWLLWKAATDLTSGEAAYVERLIQLCPQIGTARDLIPALRVLLSERQVRQLDRWLAQSEQSGISEVVGCAQGIRRDLAAVRAALQDEWSQGQTEGQVNRLKMLKRQMYGRASFALLRRRVLGQTALAP
jgi:transposase